MTSEDGECQNLWRVHVEDMEALRDSSVAQTFLATITGLEQRIMQANRMADWIDETGCGSSLEPLQTPENPGFRQQFEDRWKR